MKTLRAMPVLNVADVRASAAHYGRMGFDCHGFWGDDPVDFAVIQRGEVTIGLQFAGGPVPNLRGWPVYIYVDDVDALHAEFAAEGLSPMQIYDQPYGCREFAVTDLDGYDIAFGQDMTSNEYGPGMGPERGKG